MSESTKGIWRRLLSKGSVTERDAEGLDKIVAMTHRRPLRPSTADNDLQESIYPAAKQQKISLNRQGSGAFILPNGTITTDQLTIQTLKSRGGGFMQEYGAAFPGDPGWGGGGGGSGGYRGPSTLHTGEKVIHGATIEKVVIDEAEQVTEDQWNQVVQAAEVKEPKAPEIDPNKDNPEWGTF